MAARRVRHELWGDVPAVDSIRDFFGFAQVLTRLYGVRAWRGQADARWQLDSSLARKMRQGGHGVLDDVEALVHDDRLLEAARRGGHDAGLADLELLARLQHHGAATRLLDWTTSAMVAAWFACREHPDQDGVLLGFVAQDATPLRTDELRGLSLTGAVRRAMDGPLWWQPRGLSPRIPAQQAMLVLASISENPWGSFTPKETEGTEVGLGGVHGATVLVLSAAFKEDAAHHWGPVFGYSEETMFPDFDGFARAHGVDRPLLGARPGG